MIILGTSGSGKSTAAKLVLRSHIRNGCQIVAIDPENELEEITRTFGGDTVDIGKGGQFGMINPLEVIIDADEEEIKQGLGYTVLTRTLQSLKAFMRYYDPSITEDVLTMFSEVVQDTYKRFGIVLILIFLILLVMIIQHLLMYMQLLKDVSYQCLNKHMKKISYKDYN